MRQTVNATVAERVRDELRRQERSQAWLARQTDQTAVYITRRLKGDVPIDLHDLQAYASALGVPLSSLLPSDDKATA